MAWHDQIKQIISTISAVWSQVSPFIEPLRTAIPAFDSIVDRIEDVIDSGEQKADDILDEQDENLGKVQDFAYAASDALQELGEFIEMARQAASISDDTPDEVTAQEAAELIAKGESVLVAFKNAYDSLASAEGAIAELENLK
jgi:hypothetical protein